MRVGYDEQILLAQRHGGISRYFASLIGALAGSPELGVEPVVGWRWAPNVHARDAGLALPLPLLGGERVPGALGLAAHFLANSARRRSARHAEVLHHTYFHPRFLTARARGARVSTVYDMIPEIHPELFPRGNPHLAKARYVAASDVVPCLSEATRRDLIAIYGDPGVPMPITYLGVDPGFRPDHAPLTHAPGRFVLFVGRRGAYKDFSVAASAFAALADRHLALVAAGGGPFDDIESERLVALGIRDRVVQIDPTEQEMRQLYASALVFVFPSRHEGFGLPTLEAMASGTPVVLAGTSSHPEVGGDVARYFAPGDDDALRSRIEELLGDDALRARLGALGVERAALFTWDATARATAAAYRIALGGFEQPS